MTKLTKQEQVEALGKAEAVKVFGPDQKWSDLSSLRRAQMRAIGRVLFRFLNANGFEIVKKGGEDGNS